MIENVRPHCTLLESYGFSVPRLDLLVFCTLTNPCFHILNSGLLFFFGGRQDSHESKIKYRLRMSSLTALYYILSFRFSVRRLDLLVFCSLTNQSFLVLSSGLFSSSGRVFGLQASLNFTSIIWIFSE